MATDHQFSSLDDIFSKLPEDIIHCILGFLPCNKDVVRTSAISKSCLQAWRTFPLLDFNLDDFIPRSSILNGKEDEAKTKQFIAFVEATLQRQNDQNRIKTFNLATTNKMARHHSTRWIGIALDCKVDHLSLHIFMDDYKIRCLIPDRVLFAYWLKSLKLVGPTIYIPLAESSRVHLPLLTSLHIKDSDILDKHLQKLISGCPVLEDIALLYCNSLSKVDIFYHPNLETLEVTTSKRSNDLTAIRVMAPKLKSFAYCCVGSVDVVEIHNSPELKSLTIGDWNKTDEWFHKFTAQFPLIENLRIDSCYALRKIRISYPLLKLINIVSCAKLEDVVINCKKLASFFLLTTPFGIPNPSICMEMDNPPNDSMARIIDHINCDRLMEGSWYCKLNEFLTRPFTCKIIDIHVAALSVVDGDMKGEDLHKKLPHVACNIEKMRLVVNVPSLCHSDILNGLLSACHPTTIKLDVTSKMQFVKFICNELGNRENNIKCFCEDDFKCWKHQLKEVKIKKIKGIKLKDDLDWNAFSRLLPTLKFGNIISLNLVW